MGSLLTGLRPLALSSSSPRSEAVKHFERFVRPQAEPLLDGSAFRMPPDSAFQADLRIEADNLDMFNNNFPYRRTGKGLRVIFPEAGASSSQLLSIFSQGSTALRDQRLVGPKTRDVPDSRLRLRSSHSRGACPCKPSSGCGTPRDCFFPSSSDGVSSAFGALTGPRRQRAFSPKRRRASRRGATSLKSNRTGRRSEVFVWMCPELISGALSQWN